MLRALKSAISRVCAVSLINMLYVLFYARTTAAVPSGGHMSALYTINTHATHRTILMGVAVATAAAAAEHTSVNKYTHSKSPTASDDGSTLNIYAYTPSTRRDVGDDDGEISARDRARACRRAHTWGLCRARVWRALVVAWTFDGNGGDGGSEMSLQPGRVAVSCVCT